MKFDELVTAVASTDWQVVDRETAAVSDDYGQRTRYVKKCVIVGGRVCFVADNEIPAGGSGEALEESSVAAFLTVEATKALPAVVSELADARP